MNDHTHTAIRDDNSQPVPLDRDGYLKHLDDWSETVAEQLAAAEGITMTPAHWEIIRVLRAFYQETQHSPANRALARLIARELGAEKGRSIYLMSLFRGRGSPALLSTRIAGLPRPRNCF
ncbi:MAG: TusE/DsrC/DsvC family sulfur relay protein [Pseudohongiellaceae bacterium]